MMDDAEQLEADLAFTPRKTFSGRTVRGPPGATAITAFGLIYTGVLWVVTLGAMSQFASGPSNDVVSPGACFTLLVLGLELFIAQYLAGRTWRAIGPTARSLIRPLMILGPWPFLLVVGFGTLMVISLVRGAASGELLHQPPTVGTNWKRFELGGAERSGVTFDKATVRCLELGEGWRVPSDADLAAMSPPFEGQGQQYFWLSANDGPRLLQRTCRPRPCSLHQSQPGGAEFLAQVICFKP